jgi:RHS repeat-associated protein
VNFYAGSVPTDKLFTGQRLDGTGLYYYNARYYDPSIGRFISPDTIVPHPANPQSFNRYSYCLNNPLTYIDPSGHWPKWLKYVANSLKNEFGGMAVRIIDDLNKLQCFLNPSLSGLETNYSRLSAKIKEHLETDSQDYIWGYNNAEDIMGAVLAAIGYNSAIGRGKMMTEAEAAAAYEASAYQSASSSLLGTLQEKSELVIGRGKALDEWNYADNQFRLTWKSVQGELGMEAEARINMRLLQEVMNKRLPIKDISDYFDQEGFYLNAERLYLLNQGWIYDFDTGYWTPPPG